MLWRLWHNSNYVQRYNHGDGAWALVTGASDGIGRATVEDLLRRGFNVLIHGRNEAKLNSLKAELSALHPQQKIDTVVADASNTSYDMITDMVAKARSRRLTMLINNLGPTERRIVPLEEQNWDDVEATTAIGIRFVTQLTRALIPTLVKNQPAAILNIGSMSARYGVPYVSVYASCKSYLLTLTRCLKMEFKADGHDIEALYMDVGEVTTTAHDVKGGFIVVDSRSMGRSIVGAVGCGGTSVTPHWRHELITSIVACLPTWLVERMVMDQMRDQRQRDKKSH